MPDMRAVLSLITSHERGREERKEGREGEREPEQAANMQTTPTPSPAFLSRVPEKDCVWVFTAPRPCPARLNLTKIKPALSEDREFRRKVE